MDGDAFDIVAFDDEMHPILINGTGDVVWTAEKAVIAPIPQITVADLEGDGIVDVIADTIRVRGTDGAILNWFPVPSAIEFRIPAVGDVNLDGIQEVVIGNSLFSPDGKRKWTAPCKAPTDTGLHWLMQMKTRMAKSSWWRMAVCSYLNTTGPCSWMFRLETTILARPVWQTSMEMARPKSGGHPTIDLIYTIWMERFCGLERCRMAPAYWQPARGLILMVTVRWRCCTTTTTVFTSLKARQVLCCFRTVAMPLRPWDPTIADIDNDGSAEVLVASNTLLGPGWAGVTVFGHARDQWMQSGPTWHVHDYMVTNIEEDGTVTGIGAPPWHIHNMYRARPAKSSLSVDLQGTVVDACFTGCKGEARAKFSLQILNTGTQNTELGISVAMYAMLGGKKELIQVQEYPKRLGPGQASAAILFDVDISRIGGEGVLFVVDDDGSGFDQHEECDEDNNEVVWMDIPCE